MSELLAAPGIAFVLAVGGVASLLWAISLVTIFLGGLVEEHYTTRRLEIRGRQLEALVKIPEKERLLLLSAMPDWIDADDAEEAARWKEARAEVVGLAKYEKEEP